MTPDRIILADHPYYVSVRPGGWDATVHIADSAGNSIASYRAEPSRQVTEDIVNAFLEEGIRAFEAKAMGRAA